MNQFVKNCSECGKEMSYTFKQSLDTSIRRNCLCRMCSKKGKRSVNFGKVGFWKNKVGPNKGKVVSDDFRKKMVSIVKGRKHTEESKRKMSLNTIGKNTWSKNRIVSVETRTKLRLKRIEDLRRKGIFPGSKVSKNYNLKGCELMEKIQNKLGYRFQHALNGGEVEICGFFVDGFDKNKNVVFEYDENHHYDSFGNLREEDECRQKCIIEKINPTMFLRYNESSNKLIDVLTGEEIL